VSCVRSPADGFMSAPGCGRSRIRRVAFAPRRAPAAVCHRGAAAAGIEARLASGDTPPRAVRRGAKTDRAMRADAGLLARAGCRSADPAAQVLDAGAAGAVSRLRLSTRVDSARARRLFHQGPRSSMTSAARRRPPSWLPSRRHLSRPGQFRRHLPADADGAGASWTPPARLLAAARSSARQELTESITVSGDHRLP